MYLSSWAGAVARGEKGVQRPDQGGSGGRVVRLERPENGRAVSLDLRLGHIGQQAVHPELREDHDMARASTPAADREGAAGLGEGDVDLERICRGAADSNVHDARRDPPGDLGEK